MYVYVSVRNASSSENVNVSTKWMIPKSSNTRTFGIILKNYIIHSTCSKFEMKVLNASY